MAHATTCDACGASVTGADVEHFEDAYLAHVRSAHADWPFADNAVRNYAAARLRLAPVLPRREAIGAVELHPVDESRVEDWLGFFDRDGFAGNPAWAGCYCTEPHLVVPATAPSAEEANAAWEQMRWHQRRDAMLALLRKGGAFGYLAYVDGRAAGWVNASLRAAYTLYRIGAGAEPSDERVVGVSCFVIAPPFRRHGLAARLLDRVLADAPARGAQLVEAYPANPRTEPHPAGPDAGEFRGPRALYEARGFEAVEDRGRYTVVRRAV